MSTREEISKSFIGWVVPAICVLFVLCVVTLYQSGNHRIALLQDALQHESQRSDKLKKLGDFAGEIKPVLPDSTERASQVDKLKSYKRSGAMDEVTRNSWRLLSATSKLTVAHQLGSLTRYTEETYPLSTPLKEGYIKLLEAETRLWESVEKYVDAKYSTPNSEAEDKAFDAFTSGLLEYIKSISTVSATYLQLMDRMQALRKEGEDKHQKTLLDVEQSKQLFNLALLGAIATGLTAVIVASLIYTPLRPLVAKLRRKQEGKISRQPRAKRK